MAMKQTQTKLFDFSDVGLDFCAGSKNLFPDRFKKMLALGYNEQTVSSVAVAGNQVTFTYGGTHSYVADRVLKVNAPELLSINGGEFVIDSVTANTVTMTIDGAPTSIAGNFTTKVASLGWSLEYENANIHVYKFKHIDDSDLYIRLFFCAITASSAKNHIIPCIGRSFDADTGVITDPNAYQVNASITGWNVGHKWLFESSPTTAYNNYNYSQGYSYFGRGVIIGSAYHLLIMSNMGNSNYLKSLVGITPCFAHEYENLNFPLLIAPYIDSQINGGSSSDYLVYNNRGQGVVGNFRVVFDKGATPTAPTASGSALPTAIDTFNTATATPILLYEISTQQNIGYVSSGLFVCQFATTNSPAVTHTTSPSLHIDIDTNSNLFVHPIYRDSNNMIFFAAPIEEVKIV